MEQIIATLNRQFGRDILYPLSNIHQVSAISTTLPAMDSALGIGGLPRGHLSVFIGQPTSGATTLAYRISSSVQQRDGTLVFIDADRMLDLEYAARCGVLVNQVILIHPDNPCHAVDIACDLLTQQSPDLILATTPHVDQRLKGLLHKTTCVFLLVTPHTAEADIVLRFQRTEWLYQYDDVRGYTTQVHIQRNHFASVGQDTCLEITFDGFVEGGWTVIACVLLSHFAASLVWRDDRKGRNKPILIYDSLSGKIRATCERGGDCAAGHPHQPWGNDAAGIETDPLRTR